MDRIVNELISKENIDFNYKDEYNNSLLHTAAEGGVTSFTKTLIEKGVKINGKNLYGWAPIHFAASKGHSENIELLVQNGAEKTIRTFDGKTSYNIANEYGQSETVKFLRANDYDISQPQFPESLSKYFDTDLPDKTPKRFGTGIVSKAQTFEHGYFSFTSNLDAVCWIDWQQQGVSKTYLMEKSNGQWQLPKVVLKRAINPFISPDGQRIYFVAKRELADGNNAHDDDIYYIEREGENWGEPINLGSNVNTNNSEGLPSLTKDGSLYFCFDNDIYRSKCVNGKFAQKEKLPEPINNEAIQNQPFISQDESYLIFSTISSNVRQGPTFFITFRKKNNTWTTPINLADKIEMFGMFPSATPDNKYLFFFRQDIHWVDASEIEKLKKQELK